MDEEKGMAGIALAGPEYAMDLCAYFCWNYKTDKCPHNATADREVGDCQSTSAIGALDMTEEQVALEEEYLVKIGAESVDIGFTREIRREHGLEKL